MTNLQDKFGGLGTLLDLHHTQTIQALNSILETLGAPPPGPTTTLADVVSAITQTNTTLAGIRSDMNAHLLAIFNTLDLINSNASLNTQRTLAALAALYCPCDSDVPLLPPPLSSDPTSLENQAKCRRVQYFVDLYQDFITDLSTYVGSGAAITGDGINTILTAKLLGRSISTGELANAGGIPQSVRSTAVDQLINEIIISSRNTVAFHLLDINFLENGTALIQALYDAESAAAGKSAVDAALAASTIPQKVREVMQTLFYSAFANDLYSGVPIVDDSDYDGTICGVIEEECFTVDLALQDMGGYFRYTYYLAPTYVGWYVRTVPPTTPVRLYGDGDPNRVIDNVAVPLSTANINLGLNQFFFSQEGSGGQLEFCPPPAS